ncbi:MAG: lipopolysaccharide transport periplasmic protein LptA [Desulfamplus sp.]|nr:lipopolysaccharide transport periplasmic protein LptA [Desulfamplus sp.]
MAAEQILPEEQSKSEKQKTLTSQQDKKLHVTSDTMLVEKESSIITFSGNVVATQGTSVIKADKISVLLFTEKEKKDNKENNKHDIKSLTASGNVKFISGNRTASGDQAVYTSTDQRLVLTGDAPRVMTGESYVTGKKIILFQDSGKVIVEGGKEKRVEALFNSKEDFKKDN